MARFSDLQEQDKIQYVKDEFILILEEVAKDHSKLDKYLPAIEAKDKDAEQVAQSEARKVQRENVLEIVKNLKPKAGCLCNSCLDLNLANSVLPESLEPLIDVAKREAESKVY